VADALFPQARLARGANSDKAGNTLIVRTASVTKNPAIGALRVEFRLRKTRSAQSVDYDIESARIGHIF
jgi:hypothetical protein